MVFGYCFEFCEEVLVVVELLDGFFVWWFVEVCVFYKVIVVVGMFEWFENYFYNVFVLVGLEGIVGFYWKVYFFKLGVDNFVDVGDGF